MAATTPAQPATTAPAAARPRGFDVLRIVAACAVVVSHAHQLPFGDRDTQPDLLVFGDFAFNLGRVGVIVFFVVSGYLVCGSWLSEPRVRPFAAKRARRLMPGLLVMLALVVFVLGPLTTTAPDYFGTAGTWEYLVRNALVFPYANHLPGVFSGNPSTMVNGVLWTLGVEVLAYALIGFAGWRGWVSPRHLTAVAAVLALLGWRLVSENVAGGQLVPVALRLELIAYFFAAAAVRAWGWRPTGRAAIAAAAVVALLVAVQAPLSIALVPCGTVVVLHLGTRTWGWARPITALGDPTYGAYIYGFVAQQLLIAHLGMRDAPVWWFATVSVVAALACGYASWHLVEKRALRRRTGGQRRPRRDAVGATASAGR
ncbi:acyltransferase family protein [Kineococcus auxinigenes]|uniref:acyltransferase family protein n=1 Tax=unclassified Kineococcus TaxID=2621656 RepID=UPI003D7DA557